MAHFLRHPKYPYRPIRWRPTKV